ncbi:hypothetical protein [Flaviflexus equikiangi]|uniref:Uncharacterized protein n=1 Tax=Flaviflexus equikiangi TaxID=2758573 RepID=A0ABS2TFT0_9ACTO|nr:hypothetical protein [Flaviflexus equikiangi]MBM9433192.1 hypothetical protein [Flaviflexus equikiangi]
MADHDKDDVQLPMNEEEAIRRQRKQFMLFAIAGLVMLILAFFAGRTVKEWVSDDAQPYASVLEIHDVEA